ncbi:MULTISPECIES: pilus assembly protein TadG-related protein [Streptomyces]|uniref:Pilus assembly protein TadG-related protein n=2 Tax=Streptomyces TaxID=1883 RepID=A0ABV9IHR9_9ACTN
MTRRRRLRYGDAGQAFPIYITVVAGLLFLAFAYFAVGQAAVNRSGAQTAADAAALAAAQDTRDQLADLWVLDVLDPTRWQDIFDGVGATNGCDRAYQLAAMNDASAECSPDGPLSYTVTAQTKKSVGDSVVPGTEDVRAHANATAVIESLCTFDLPDPGTPDPGTPTPGTPTGTPDPGTPDPGTPADPLPRLTCKDRDWDLDPDDPAGLPGPEDLFDVHLATRAG